MQCEEFPGEGPRCPEPARWTIQEYAGTEVIHVGWLCHAHVLAAVEAMLEDPNVRIFDVARGIRGRLP